MDYIKRIRSRASKVPKKIILSEGTDDRVILAAIESVVQGLGVMTLIGPVNLISEKIKKFTSTFQPKKQNEILSKIEDDHDLYPKVLDRRGTAYERIGNWELAEKDLSLSLKILPNQAYTINYLAYSWIEKEINTEKALTMLKKADNLKNLFNEINVLEWGDLPKFDMIINATTLGLNKVDKFGIDFSQAGQNKLFYDVIYAPFQTEFSEAGNVKGNSIENGLNMFLFQGQQAFNIWHNVEPEINKELIEFLKS